VLGNPKLARLIEDEIGLLLDYRSLPAESQEHLRELAKAMLARYLSSRPGNVVLLADPKRKFR
jgi:uncharacterized protein (UPF0212 family)